MGENNDKISSIQITPEVISSIAAAAALDVDGVAGLETASGFGFKGFFKKKTVINGVEVSQEKDGVTLKLNALAYFGCKLSELGAEVQKCVKEAVESMAGTKVKKVDINIVGIEKREESDEPSEGLYAEISD